MGLHPVAVCRKVPILDFRSEFSMSKIIGIFLNFFSLKNNSLGQTNLKFVGFTCIKELSDPSTFLKQIFCHKKPKVPRHEKSKQM